MPQYTEYERALRHLQRYNKYPPPPRQYRKWERQLLGNNQTYTEILAAEGTVYQADGQTFAEDGLKVEVTNLATGVTLTSLTGDAGSGRYSVTFTDFSGGQVAAIGDKIEVKVYNNINQLIALATSTVTATEIEMKVLTLNVTSGSPITHPYPQKGLPAWGWFLIIGLGALYLSKK